MKEAVEELYKEWAKRRPVVGSPRTAIQSIKLQLNDTIYISGTACDNHEKGSRMNAVAACLLKLGYGIFTSEEDLRGPDDGDGVWGAIEKSILNSAVFVTIRTKAYGDRDRAKQSSSELDLAIRMRKNIINLGFVDGENWDVDFQGSKNDSATFDKCMSMVEIKLRAFGVKPSEDAKSDLSEGSGYQLMETESNFREAFSLTLSERSNVSAKLGSWLDDNGWSHLKESLAHAGVLSVRAICRLIRQDGQEDLKQLLLNDSEAKKFTHNVRKLHRQVYKEEFDQGAMEQVIAAGKIASNIPLIGNVVGLVVNIVEEAKTLSEQVEERQMIEIKCGLARRYLEALPESNKWERLKDKEKILQGVEDCVLEIDNILLEVQGELKELKHQKESTSFMVSIRKRFSMGIKQKGLHGCLERFDDKLRAQKEQITSLLNLV